MWRLQGSKRCWPEVYMWSLGGTIYIVARKAIVLIRKCNKQYTRQTNMTLSISWTFFSCHSRDRIQRYHEKQLVTDESIVPSYLPDVLAAITTSGVDDRLQGTPQPRPLHLILLRWSLAIFLFLTPYVNLRPEWIAKIRGWSLDRGPMTSSYPYPLPSHRD
jgi:hypothetical protein